jgi:hypothetical protein
MKINFLMKAAVKDVITDAGNYFVALFLLIIKENYV